MRNQHMPFKHSPCIINLDDLGHLGTHWVCCWKSDSGYEYFDSFGIPPPLEWERELEKRGVTSFLRNDDQLQKITSVRCGYYCLLFLSERNRGPSYEQVLKMFSIDPEYKEKVVKSYFLNTNHIC